MQGRKPNHLATETSPYLLQHAHNPVDWYPWGDAALARAKTEDKPIFLSVGYAACHWCHVMEHESFEDEEVAALLNEHFVSIKVDREERPDIDAVYMTATVAMTGGGGWPMTVFMTPDGRPFFAGTYFSKASRYGRPGFAGDQEDRGALEDEPRRPPRPTSELHERGRDRGSPRRALLGRGRRRARAAEQLIRALDSTWGGFGSAPKFPTPSRSRCSCATTSAAPSSATSRRSRP
ncbi:MAG: thioredoxin domain-containing protein [Polyangiaceae bacterium]